ncbi:MAG: MBL fold metallo-hydrolase [Bacteroidota bacterium]
MTTSPTPPSKPRRRWRRIVGGLSLAVVLLLTLLMFDAWKALGTKPAGERLVRLEASPQYRDGRFVNVLPQGNAAPSMGTMREFFFGGSDHRTPAAPPPTVARTAADFAAVPDDLRVTWLGHSTFLVELDGVRLLIDPVWGERVSPSSFIGSRRFHAPPLPLDALPPVDAVLISHDHYDHLDFPTIRTLTSPAFADRVPRFLVPLGIGAHLEYWGVDPARIEEVDWWDEKEVGTGTNTVRLVSTPARHFSGRFVNDRDATLWTGWAFLGAERRVFYSGDTALTPSFAEVGERLGPFDLTLIEVGAYNEAWSDVHLGPEQAVAVHRMVRGEVMMPVHWCTFDLSLHGWTEPAERVRTAADALGIPVAFPRPGEHVTLDAVPTAAWWPALPWDTAAEAPAVSTGLPDEVRALVP